MKVQHSGPLRCSLDKALICQRFERLTEGRDRPSNVRTDACVARLPTRRRSLAIGALEKDMGGRRPKYAGRQLTY
jgi:hypothetical protein